MLQVKDLCYDVIENGQKITLLKDVSFDVQDGEMLVICLLYTSPSPRDRG